MPDERQPRRWVPGSGGRSSASPSNTRRFGPGSTETNKPQQQQKRWGSNLSIQRRERAVVWASCLQKVQALRQGGSWQRPENGAAAGSLADGGSGSASLAGATALVQQQQQQDDDKLNDQLDILATLTYPNSSISPQDAGFMVSALCEAAPRCSCRLSARVAQFFVSLCAKQQKVAFLAWQLNIVLDFLVASLPPGTEQASSPAEQASQPSQEPPLQAPPPTPSLPPSPPARPPSGRRDCARALAQLLYENGERLGTRFDDVLPPLLGLADSSAVDLDTKHAALDALANLSLKNWAGCTEPQRQAVCSSLTKNFVKHWRVFTPSSSSSSSSTTIAAVESPAGASSGGAAALKVLASTTRGLACAINKSGVSPVIEPYLARVVHALNHLVQPAGEGERAATAAAAARGVSGSGGGGSRSTSGSRSRGRSSIGLGGYGGSGGGSGSGGVSPTRSSASASLADPRARVRLQALTLLESIAVKDAKSLYQHWALFFSPCVPGFASGATAASGLSKEGAGSNNPVLPAGLVSILENDDAPQVRAAAAAAAASLVKNAPLRKWMLLLPPPTPPSGIATTSAGGSGVGIGERVESMMLHLHRSLVSCLAREKSPAVVAKLCACAGALIVEMPYAAAVSWEWSTTGDSRRTGGPGGRAGVEESLRVLLRALARLMVNVTAEPIARIAASQALTAAFSTKEPAAAIDSFLLSFRCAAATPSSSSSSSSGGWAGVRTTAPFPPSPSASAALAVAARRSSSSMEAGLAGWSPLPLRPGSADDRGNRFVVGGARNSSAKQRLRPASSPLGKHEGSRVEKSTAGSCGEGGRSGGGADEGGGGGGGGGGGVSKPENARGSPHQMPPSLPRTKLDEAVVSTPHSTNSSSSSSSSQSFVDLLIALAGAPGQLRAEALGLLTRIGRSYPAHLSGVVGGGAGSGDGGGGAGGAGGGSDGDGPRKSTWDRVSALLLGCFADPDQNLRLHALKVLEALLLARAEQAAAVSAAAAAAAAAEQGGAAGGAKVATAAAAPAAESVSPQQRPTQPRPEDEDDTATGRLREGQPGGAAPLQQQAVVSGGGEEGGRSWVEWRNGISGGTGAERDLGGDLWRDLVQKHLQRALEDPYHGVRAVACSCHACLLDSDWAAFSDRERDRCLDRVLAATKDRAAGVNILACRVIAGVMTMTGREGAAAWCREPQFLGRCAGRLQDMMEDPKATIRGQAMLAVGNLACSLHSIRSRRSPPLPPPPPPPPPSIQQHPVLRRSLAAPVCLGDLVTRPRLRALCNGALRLTATEPDHAAGSAVRALGYLAWGLDPEPNAGGSGGGGGGGGGDGDSGDSSSSRVSGGGSGGERQSGADIIDAAPAAPAGGVPKERGRNVENGEKEAEGEGGEDRDLQNKTVLALAIRLAPETGTLALSGGGGTRGERGTGGRGAGRSSVGDRRAEIAAAKCSTRSSRWVVELLHCPGDRSVRKRDASEDRRGVMGAGTDAFPSKVRVLHSNKHLKVRTHAAHALKTVPDVRAYGDQLSAILGGSLRGLRACRQRSIVADPTQMRYAGELEAALRSLLLHILLALVLDDHTPAANEPARSDAGGRGGHTSATAALLGEHAENVLEVLSSPESDTALSPSGLFPYYRRGHRQIEEKIAAHFTLTAEMPQQQQRQQQQEQQQEQEQKHQQQYQQLECRSPLLPAAVVLAAAAEGLVHLFGRRDGDCGSDIVSNSGGGGGGGGGGGVDSVEGGGDGSGGGTQETEQLPMVSKQTWTACVAEARRRRLRVAQLLAGIARCSGGGALVGGGEERGGATGCGGVAALGSEGLRVTAAAAMAAAASGGGGGGAEEKGDDEI
ncbi:unnamed protein product [Pylaiella littoralis]